MRTQHQREPAQLLCHCQDRQVIAGDVMRVYYQAHDQGILSEHRMLVGIADTGMIWRQDKDTWQVQHTEQF